MTWLFDFDGTLVDSMPTYSRMMLGILNDYGVAYPDNVLKITTPLGYAGTARYFRTLGIPATEEELIARMNREALAAYSSLIPAKANVAEVLRALRARGDDLNVLTASPHTMLDPCLKNNGIYDLFTNVWSCEDFGTTKADPNIYRMAAKRLDKAVDEVWFLDDNLEADTTAVKAGMMVCGVYDDSSADVEEQIRAVAHRYIRDFTELLTF